MATHARKMDGKAGSSFVVHFWTNESDEDVARALAGGRKITAIPCHAPKGVKVRFFYLGLVLKKLPART
jgi:hypothetical protein